VPIAFVSDSLEKRGCMAHGPTPQYAKQGTGEMGTQPHVRFSMNVRRSPLLSSMTLPSNLVPHDMTVNMHLAHPFVGLNSSCAPSIAEMVVIVER
jgi:hypothetical protein